MLSTAPPVSSSSSSSTSIPHDSTLSSSPSSTTPFPTIESNPVPVPQNSSSSSTPVAINTTTTISSQIPPSIESSSVSTVSPTTRSRANTTSRYAPGGPSASQKPPLEVLLYRNASECPICFLYYPKYLNLTRCCAQPICTECFVQIKRPDPHPPHDEHPDDDTSSVSATSNNNNNNNNTDSINGPIIAGEPLLVSEPACCPYCMVPEFGVTFTPCPYRSGLEPSSANKKIHSLSPLNIFNQQQQQTPPGSLQSLVETGTSDQLSSPSPSSLSPSTTAASSTSALSATIAGSGPSRRRGSIPANAPDVVTIDRIRPDWSIKLASARAHAARRSAQATALHASAFLLDNTRDVRGGSGSSSRRSRGIISGRRARAYSGSNGAGSSESGNNSSASSAAATATGTATGNPNSTNIASGTSASSRPATRSLVDAAINSRMQHLEETMLMEAIRLSLIEEENRKLKLAAEQQNQSEGGGGDDASSSSTSVSGSTTDGTSGNTPTSSSNRGTEPRSRARN